MSALKAFALCERNGWGNIWPLSASPSCSLSPPAQLCPNGTFSATCPAPVSGTSTQWKLASKCKPFHISGPFRCPKGTYQPTCGLLRLGNIFGDFFVPDHKLMLPLVSPQQSGTHKKSNNVTSYLASSPCWWGDLPPHFPGNNLSVQYESPERSFPNNTTLLISTPVWVFLFK